jgi:hypothetical protein
VRFRERMSGEILKELKQGWVVPPCQRAQGSLLFLSFFEFSPLVLQRLFHVVWLSFIPPCLSAPPPPIPPTAPASHSHHLVMPPPPTGPSHRLVVPPPPTGPGCQPQPSRMVLFYKKNYQIYYLIYLVPISFFTS